MEEFGARLSSRGVSRALRAAALSIALASALVAAAGVSAAPGRFDLGVYDPLHGRGAEGSAFSLPAGLAMAKTRAAGARFVRIPITWSRVACPPQEVANCTQDDRPAPGTRRDPSSYEWKRAGIYDHVAEIDAAFANGLIPVLVVFEAPPYAECNGTGERMMLTQTLVCGDGYTRGDDGSWKPSATDYANFMVALAERFPRVKYFEVWNEPNFSLYLKPGRTTEAINIYRRLVNQTSQALHKLNRGIKVIAGATSANARRSNNEDWKSFSPKEFARKLLSREVRFDAYSVHPYTPGGPRTRAESSTGAVWMGNLGQLKAILAGAKKQHGWGSTTLWVSEFNWDSAPPDCRRNVYTRNGQRFIERAVPHRLLTRWISEASYEMWRQGVSVWIWHQLKDHPIDRSHYQGGLYYWGGEGTTGSAKPIVRPFRFPFAAFKKRGGAYIWGRRPGGRSGTVVVQARTAGKWTTVARVRSRGSGLVSKRLWFDRSKVSAMRGLAAGQTSASFSLKRPRVPIGIQPFGCTNLK